MMQRLQQLFRGDFWLKVLAVSLAVLMWAMVVQDYNKETSVSFDIPLAVKQHPVFEMFEGRQDKDSLVEVRVTGPSLLVDSLSPGEIEAWVDYSVITESGRTQDVEVMVKGPDRIKNQVKYRVTPSTVGVTLVENRTVAVPVAVAPQSGVVTVGAREFRYTVSPLEKNILISGRQDYLEYVRSALVALDEPDLMPKLENGALVDPTTQLHREVTPVDATGQKVEKLAQHYTDVVVNWEELPPGKKVQVRFHTVGSLPPGFELSGVSVEPTSITLRSGTVEGLLPDVDEVDTEPVDLTGQTKPFTTAVRVIAPPGTTVAQSSVNVTVSITEARVEKLFGALPVSVSGQPIGSEVTLETPTVQVRLTGPFTQLQPLDAGSVGVYVDLDGLAEGRHRVPVKVTYPPGIPEVAVDPAMIEVVITNR